MNCSSNLKIFENCQDFKSFSHIRSEQFWKQHTISIFQKKIKIKVWKFFKNVIFFSFFRCGIQQSKQFKRIEFRGRSQAGGHFKSHFRCHFALVTTIHRVTGQSAPFSAYEHYSRPFRSTSRPNKIK